MSFWGLILEPKKSYTQRGVEQPFHISSAALDLQTCDDAPVSVVCRKSDQDFILCSLSKAEGIFNVPLNLDFELGSEINFHVVGDSTVHLTGYIVDDMELEDDDSSLDELEEEEDSKVVLKNTKKLLDAASSKRKPENSAQNKSKKAKVEVDEDDDDEEDDSDFDMEESMEGEEELGEEEEDDDEEDDDDDDDDDDDEEDDNEAAEVLKKLQAMKGDKSKQGKNQQPAKGSPKVEQNAKQGKKDQAKAQNQNQKQANKQNGAPQTNGVTKKVLSGGLQVEDMQIGSGPAAAPGKMVAVYYAGRLKSNNKQFDACQSGPGFKFRVGKGEVIQGWDLGVAGMKVGGKRRLTIPAKLGYGKEGAGKTIPPNSTLVFDVELRHVK